MGFKARLELLSNVAGWRRRRFWGSAFPEGNLEYICAQSGHLRATGRTLSLRENADPIRQASALILWGRKPQNRRFVLPACSAGILPAWDKLKETAGWKPALRLPGREQNAQKV